MQKISKFYTITVYISFYIKSGAYMFVSEFDNNNMKLLFLKFLHSVNKRAVLKKFQTTNYHC